MSRIQVAIRISSKAPPDYKKRRQLWHLFAQEADVVEQRLLRVLVPYFRRIKREVLERLERIGPSVEGQYRGWSRRKVVEHISRKSPIDRINIDKATERKALYQLFEPLVKLSMERRGGEMVNAQLGSTIQFNVNDPACLEWLGTRMDEFSRSVSGTTFDEIKATLRAGFSEGQPVSKIADTLRARFESFEKFRAPLIARTETISALNKTDLLAIAQAGIKDRLVKYWITAGDENVRDSHRQAGNDYSARPIPIDGMFRVGNDPVDSMEAPGLGKVAKENINCRCTVGYDKIERAGQPKPPPPAPPIKPLPKPAPTVIPPPLPAGAVPAWAEKPTPVGNHVKYANIDNDIIRARGERKQRLMDVREKTAEAVETIGKVHDDGPLNDIPFTAWSNAGSDTLGHYVPPDHNPLKWDPAGEIQVNMTAPLASKDHYMETIIHEIGHWIDNQGLMAGKPIPPVGFQKRIFATQVSENLTGDGILAEWATALKNSEAYKKYASLNTKAMLKVPIDVEIEGVRQAVILDYRFTQYATSNIEMFARSYMQYVAEKSGNKEILATIEKVRQRRVFGEVHQWDTEDFKPIKDAFDNLFRKLGWLKS